MVLQNKFKARASRRYNKTHGEGTSTAKPNHRQKQPRQPGISETQQDGSDDSGSDPTSDEEEDLDFPSLAKAAEATDSTKDQEEQDDPSNPSSGRYARRKMGESRLAMMERLEAAKDPRLEAEEEPEPEVDLSGLLAKVAALGDSGASQAGIAQEIAKHRAAHETASDVEQDIDHSLAYLHEKERQRQKAKGRGGADEHNKPALVESVDMNSEDVEAMKKDKEKAEAVRALKARFQGRDLGERERSDAKSRNAPSLKIGSKSSGSSGASVDSASTSTTKPVSASLAAEIDSSLAKARGNGAKGDAGSVKSERSTFSTSFGRARGNSHSSRSPLASGSTPSPPSSSTDGIDGFLRSLNDRSVLGGKDESIFTLKSGSNSPKFANRYPTSAHASYHHYRQKNGQAQTVHSTPGELGRMENFLDTMLG